MISPRYVVDTVRSDRRGTVCWHLQARKAVSAITQGSIPNYRKVQKRAIPEEKSLHQRRILHISKVTEHRLSENSSTSRSLSFISGARFTSLLFSTQCPNAKKPDSTLEP